MEKSSTTKGVELTISGYSSGYTASDVDMLLRLTPAIDASDDSEELVRETISGASFDDTVYTLGMLKPTTRPMTPATQHHLRMVFQFFRSFLRSSIRSISSYCSS